MAMSFDTLSFAKRLTEAGEKPSVAEAHAMALKEFVMDAVATKADIKELGRNLGEEIQDVRDDVAELRIELTGIRSEIAGIRTEITDVRDATRDDFANVRSEMRGEFANVRNEMRDEFVNVRSEMREGFTKARQELDSFRQDVSRRLATKDELRHEVGLLRKDIDAMGLKLTVRLGGMLVVAVGAIATLGKVV